MFAFSWYVFLALDYALSTHINTPSFFSTTARSRTLHHRRSELCCVILERGLGNRRLPETNPFCTMIFRSSFSFEVHIAKAPRTYCKSSPLRVVECVLTKFVGRYIIPFVRRVLEATRDSVVFRPPNPWTMAILSLLKELHQVGCGA